MTVYRHTLLLVVCLTTLKIAQNMWRRMMTCKEVFVALRYYPRIYLEGLDKNKEIIQVRIAGRMVFKSKNHSKTQFHRNGLLATLCTNFQEGQN